VGGVVTVMPLFLPTSVRWMRGSDDVID
jgi:hypothetical protein